MKKINRILFVLHIFVGVGAVFGGIVAIVNPNKPFGITTEALSNSPFNNYLIPGIILFVILGLGNIVSAVIIKTDFKYQGYISVIFTGALAVWIVVQCIMLNTIHPAHVLYFTIGIIGIVLAALVVFEQQLFPANIIIKYYKAIRKEV